MPEGFGTHRELSSALVASPDLSDPGRDSGLDNVGAGSLLYLDLHSGPRLIAVCPRRDPICSNVAMTSFRLRDESPTSMPIAFTRAAGVVVLPLSLKAMSYTHPTNSSSDRAAWSPPRRVSRQVTRQPQQELSIGQYRRNIPNRILGGAIHAASSEATAVRPRTRVVHPPRDAHAIERARSNVSLSWTTSEGS